MLKTLEEPQGQEDKKSKAGQTGHLPKGDGKAKVLTQEDFFEMLQRRLPRRKKMQRRGTMRQKKYGR